MAFRFLLIFAFVPYILFAGNLDRIRKSIVKNEFEKAKEIIIKALEKEPDNPGLSYFKSRLHFDISSPYYHLDSARMMIEKSLADYSHSDGDTREDLWEDEVSHVTIFELFRSIRLAQYRDLKNVLTIKNITKYLEIYPIENPYRKGLLYQRDSIAYDSLVQVGSIPQFEYFINQYVASNISEEAKVELDRLRFNKLKETGQLDDYYHFHKSYPETHYREEVEHYILKHSTTMNEPSEFLDFVDFAHSQKWKKRAFDILYYISKNDSSFDFTHSNTDSLRLIQDEEDAYYFPAADRNKVGFHSTNGALKINYQFEGISSDIKCSTTRDEWIFVKGESGDGMIINKLGKILIDKARGYEDLGYGVALVKLENGHYLFHKSGFQISEQSLEGAEVINGRWIKVYNNGYVNLISFQGVSISDETFDEIYLKSTLWVFESQGKIAISKEETIMELLRERGGLGLSFEFEDFELTNDNLILGYNRNQECLMNMEMEVLIPWGNYEIYPNENGWYLKSEFGYQLYSEVNQSFEAEYHPKLEMNKGWVIIKTVADWRLIPKTSNLKPMQGYDSLRLINDHAILKSEGNELNLLFYTGLERPINQDNTIRVFKENLDYINVSDTYYQYLYDQNGTEIFKERLDDIQFLNDTLLKVTYRGKLGLMNLKGDYLLRPDFTSINESDNFIQLLSRAKIGGYDLHNGTRLEAQYEARIERLDTLYKVKKGGKYGLIDRKENEVISFSYDEIEYWNDTSFMVINDGYRQFINLGEEVVIENIQEMRRIITNSYQTIYLFVKNGKYGLIGSMEGIIANAEYSDIFNIGQPETPLFFADQNLSRAGFHVVSYLDQTGKLILSKAYRNEEFDLLLCDF